MKQRIQIDIEGWLEKKFSNIRKATYPDVALCCPYCADSRFRLYVATQDHGAITKGWGWCHNEGVRRDFFEMFRDFENITDQEAVEQLYSTDPTPMRADYTKTLELLGKVTVVEEIKEEEVPVVWPSDYVRLFGLTDTEWTTKVPRYMVERKLDKAMCDRYYLGYCGPNERTGFAGRMIVPIYQHKKLVGYQGRGMHPAIQPKYRFMKGIKAGDFLYNLDAIPEHYDTVILTEGVFDVWGVIRCGFPNVVCSFGKHLTDKGVRTLVNRFKKVLIFWDMDAKDEICALAEKLEGQIDVIVSSLNGKDPDEAEPFDVQFAIGNASPYTRSYRRMALMQKLSN